MNYSTYDKEFYSLVQALKQWIHYLLGKETILHTDHHPLIFINSLSNIQEQRHLKWASYIQQFHLVIRYKKGTLNKLADLLNRSPTIVLSILEVRCTNYDTWKDQYATDSEFQKIWIALHRPTEINQTPFLDYNIQDVWLYNSICYVFHTHRNTSFSLGSRMLQRMVDTSVPQRPFEICNVISIGLPYSLQLRNLFELVHYAPNPSHPTKNMAYISHCLFLHGLGTQSPWNFSVESQPPKINMMQSG